jgi:hypothetical protein
MKKQLFTLCLFLATAVTIAQSPRLSLFEEFTGETCPPCAQTNPGLDAKLANPTNTPLVVAIKWQVPIPSTPSATWSLYKSNQTEIAQRAAYYPSQSNSGGAITNYINSAPQGRFDGQHQWVFGATSDHPTYVSNAIIATAASYTSAFSIVLAKEMAQSNAAFNVTVNILCTAPFTSNGALVFRTVMVDRLIQFSVQPGSNGEKTFHDVAVKSFPSLQSGTPLPNTWVVGQSKTFTLSCPIPGYLLLNGERDRYTTNLDFVGFIQDNGNKKVEQAARGSECFFITASVTNTEVCDGQPVTLTANGASNYTWNNGQTGNSIVVNPTADGTYYVTSADPNACPNRGEVSLKVFDCTGIKKLANNGLQVEIYPNPSKGEFLIKADFATDKNHVVIYNNLGQKVYDQALNQGETAVKTNLAKGLYTYEILENSQKISTGKLVIE